MIIWRTLVPRVWRMSHSLLVKDNLQRLVMSNSTLCVVVDSRLQTSIFDPTITLSYFPLIGPFQSHLLTHIIYLFSTWIRLKYTALFDVKMVKCILKKQHHVWYSEFWVCLEWLFLFHLYVSFDTIKTVFVLSGVLSSGSRLL